MTDDYPPAPTPEPAPAADPVPPGNGDAAHRLSLGQVVTGAILVMIGIAWLFEAADWADIPWRGLLAGALIVVGVALMLGARRGSHGGLIAFGVILAVVMAVSSAIEVLADIPLSGGIGEQQHRPVVQVDDEYRWGIGSMKLDLRDVETELEGLTIEASVGIGELIVYVPGEVAVDVDARSGIGEVDIFGQKSAGLGSDLHVADEADPRLVLDLDVAIGKVEVRR